MEWKAQNIDNAKYLGCLEIGESVFEVMETEDKLVFGTSCNISLLQSGYIEKDGFNTDEVLQELVADLEVYYSDGPEYVSMIVTNDRM